MKYARDSTCKKNHIEAHRNTELIDLRFQFPKFRLVRHTFFLLHVPLHRVLNGRSYRFIEMKTRKRIQASAFSLP